MENGNGSGPAKEARGKHARFPSDLVENSPLHEWSNFMSARVLVRALTDRGLRDDLWSVRAHRITRLYITEYYVVFKITDAVNKMLTPYYRLRIRDTDLANKGEEAVLKNAADRIAGALEWDSENRWRFE